MLIVKTASNGTAVLAKTYGSSTNPSMEQFRALALTPDRQYLYAGATQGGESLLEGGTSRANRCNFPRPRTTGLCGCDLFPFSTGTTTYATMPPTTINGEV